MADLRSTTFKSNLLVSAWTKWITPRSEEHDEMFRERTVRGMVVLWLAVVLVFGSLVVVLGAWSRMSQILMVFLFDVVVTITVSRGHIRLAGWILVLQSITFAVFSMVQVGYWAPGTLAASVLALLLGAMLLPPSNARIVPFMLVTIYGGLAIWLDAQGMVSPLPPSNPFSAPLPATVSFGLIIFVLGGQGPIF